jgi:hypothetical protein
MSGTNRGAQRSAQRTPQRIVIASAGNRFDVDLRKRPQGMTYEWKAQTIMGFELLEQQIMQEANGWTPVPAERHPELTGSRGAKGGIIKRGGQILMERPNEITAEARELEDFAARYAVGSQLQKLKLSGHRAGGKGIKKSYEPPPDAIPDD